MALSSLRMNLDYIRTFVVLGQSNNMTEAGKKLGVNVSYVSRHLQKLEDELQVKLLVPNAKNRDLQLTDAGKYFFDKYEKIYNEILLTEKEYRQTEQLDNCKMTIGVASDLEDIMLKDKLRECATKLPNIVVKIVNGDTELLSKKLMQYTVDIIIDKSEPINNSKLQDIETVELFSSNYCFAYNRNFFKGIKDLNGQPLIVPVSKMSERKLINDYLEQKEINVDIKYEVNSFDRMLSYVNEGLGIGFFLKTLVIDDEHLEIIDTDITCRVCLSYIKDKLTPSTKEFIKLYGIKF